MRIKGKQLLVAIAPGVTCPVYSIEHHGVTLESRYCLEHEFEAMTKIADNLPDFPGSHTHEVRSIYVDSKACEVYSIRLRRTPSPFHPAVLVEFADGVEAAIVDACGGHNGIFIENEKGKVDYVRDPSWPDPEVWLRARQGKSTSKTVPAAGGA